MRRGQILFSIRESKFVSIVLLTIVVGLTGLTKVFAEIPIGYNKWDMENGKHRANIGGMMHNYQKPDGKFAKIVNAFSLEGDSVVYNNRGIIKTRVNKQGLSRATIIKDGDTVSVSSKLIGVGWLNIETDQRQWIDSTMNWSNPSIVDSTIKWPNVSPGIDYRIIKSNGQLAHKIIFKPAFLDSAVALYNQRADSLDIALANVIQYSFSSNIDKADSVIGYKRERRLKKFIEFGFDIKEQALRYDGDINDTLLVPVGQFWKKRNGEIYCIEYVMMSDIKRLHEAMPTKYLWHNADIDITDDNFEDATIREDATNFNYGGGIGGGKYIEIYYGNTGNEDSWVGLLRGLNLNTILGSGYSVTYCTLYVYVAALTEGDVDVYRMLKIDWEEGTGTGAITADVDVGATGDYWSNSTSETWAVQRAAQCDNDNGEENTWGNTLTCSGHPSQNAKVDRWATIEVTKTISATGYHGFDLTALAQLDDVGSDKRGQDSLNIFMRTDDNTGSKTDILFRSMESTSDNPYFTFIYTPGGGGGDATPTRRRKMIQEIGVSDEVEDDTWLVDYNLPVNITR